MKTEIPTVSSSKRPKQSTTAGSLFMDEPRTRVAHGMLPAMTTPPPSKERRILETQVSGLSASFLVVPDVVDVASNMTIPSSQSQDAPSMADMLSKTSSVPSSMGSTEVDSLVIQSSQSQLLIMASPIMRKLEITATLPSLDVVIPSSQSQERELNIPTENDVAAGSRDVSFG